MQIYVYNTMKEVIAFTLLISSISSIGIPLNPMQTRCMIAYTDDNYETLKLDVKFPVLPDQTSSELYQIQIYNTETHQTLYETIANGRYRKQMDLDEHAIYRFCFTLMTSRQHISGVIIDYNSDIEYYETKKTIKIPENLLKSEQTKVAYEKVMRMDEIVELYQKFSDRKREEQNQHYIATMEVTGRLTIISYIEIIVVLIAGIYQFFKIRKFLVDRQYM